MKKLIMLVLAGFTMLTVGAAGAYFTAEAQMPDSVIRAGAVAISTEPTCAALSIDALAPGATVTKPVTIVNDGNLPVTVVATAAKKAGISDFFEALTCRVTCDGDLLYEGALATLRTSALAMPAGSRSQLQFAIGLPASAGNDLAGDYAKVSLYFDAEQAH